MGGLGRGWRRGGSDAASAFLAGHIGCQAGQCRYYDCKTEARGIDVHRASTNLSMIARLGNGISFFGSVPEKNLCSRRHFAATTSISLKKVLDRKSVV